MFCAPRCTVSAIGAVRALVFFSKEDLAEAEALFLNLAGSKGWVPMARYQDRGAILVRLDKLGLVWKRFQNGVGEIKVPPAALRQCVTGRQGF